MNLVIKKAALNTILEVATWVESQNTEGAGSRWYNKLIDELEKSATLHLHLAICKNHDLALLKYHCLTYQKKWIVAYKIQRNRFVIYRFLHGAWLK